MELLSEEPTIKSELKKVPFDNLRQWVDLIKRGVIVLKKPTVIFLDGVAGAGKTTFLKQFAPEFCVFSDYYEFVQKTRKLNDYTAYRNYYRELYKQSTQNNGDSSKLIIMDRGLYVPQLIYKTIFSFKNRKPEPTLEDGYKELEEKILELGRGEIEKFEQFLYRNIDHYYVYVTPSDPKVCLERMIDRNNGIDWLSYKYVLWQIHAFKLFNQIDNRLKAVNL